MAEAVSQAGFDLHVWARHPRSLAAVSGVAHTTHDDVQSLGNSRRRSRSSSCSLRGFFV
jgi:hypothetical protein